MIAPKRARRGRRPDEGVSGHCEKGQQGEALPNPKVGEPGCRRPAVSGASEGRSPAVIAAETHSFSRSAMRSDAPRRRALTVPSNFHSTRLPSSGSLRQKSSSAERSMVISEP